MKNVYEEQAQVGEAINRVKDNQDRILDVYDESNHKLKALMRELVQLEKELEDLDNEYDTLIKTL
jgi:prefoldin subunit 5